MNIDIYKLRDLKLNGATVIDGFSSASMISSIVANYLINSLDLDQISILDSDDFPAISLIYGSKPKYPAGIFADGDKNIVVFLSEFTPGQQLVRYIANTILAWAAENECKRIIATGALTVPEEGRAHKEHKMFGVGSVDRARRDLEKMEIRQLKTGYLTGIPAMLLNSGMRANFDVICLLAESQMNNGMPDTIAAAKVLEVIARLLPKVGIDLEPLYEEAEMIEDWINEQQQSPSLMFR